MSDIVRYLVENVGGGGEADAVDARGRSALHYAVESGQLDAATYLLSRFYKDRSGTGTGRTWTDSEGRSLLTVAIFAGRPEMVSLLLDSSIGRDLATYVDGDGRGPVHYWVLQEAAAAEDQPPSNNNNNNNNLTNNNNNNNSSTAARTRRAAILYELVSHRCDVNLADGRGGLTPLMYAARAGRAASIAALLQLPPATAAGGAPIAVNRLDADGRTALHHCCSATPAPSLRCCRALVRAGVDANHADRNGVTALMLACQSYLPGMNVSVIRYLVEHGRADPVRQDKDGRDSFDYCPPIDADYLRAVLREGAGMANAERSALRAFVDHLVCLQQQRSSASIAAAGGEGPHAARYSLHIASVLRGLVREGIFTKTLSFEVMKQAPADRLRKLVDLLCTRGDRAFGVFCRVLRDEADQPEMAYMMMKAAYRRQREIFC
jgi:ankyrin repeat protein